MILRGDERDLPGVPVVKISPSSAEGVDSIPGGGAKIPHTMRQLSPHAAFTKLMHYN